MRSVILSILLLSFVSELVAQITLTDSSFPKEGDTLLVERDNLPNDILPPSSGPDQYWQFGSLEAPFAQQIIIRDRMEGNGRADFPDADIVASLGNNLEGYYKTINQELVFLGTYGSDPIGLELSIALRINPGITERKAPLKYNDTYNSSGFAAITIPADQLPQDFIDQLPIVPDSFRLRLQTDREVKVDGWGTINIPNGEYPVLKERRVEKTNLRLDAKISFFPWQDITGLIPNSNQLGEQTVISHHFLNNDEKEPIAIAIMNQDETQVLSVEYKAGPIITSITDPGKLKPGVLAYPNPAIGFVRFSFNNLPAGDYQLKIFDILGSEVWSETYTINNNVTEKADISPLRKGTYLYSLINKDGKTLVTRRLIVLRP